MKISQTVDHRNEIKLSVPSIEGHTRRPRPLGIYQANLSDGIDLVAFGLEVVEG